MAGKSPDQQSKYSLFDIAGPIMVGPSSSHTAGACKLGQIARALFHGTPENITFILHGSFATVYKGHATDRALLAGIMRFKTSDEKIKNAFRIAKQRKISYKFKTADLGASHHPNTVKIILEKKGRKPMSMIGSSIGGGIVQVFKIDQFDVSLHGVAGHYKTLVVWHENIKGTRESLLKEIAKKKIKVIEVQTARIGQKALTIINMDGRRMNLPEVLELEKLPNISDVRTLTAIEK